MSRATTIAIGAGLVAALVAEASAHYIPARRQVIAQVDAGRATFLVTWTSERGPQGSQMIARALWGRKGKHRQAAIEALAAHEALAGLDILADGASVKPASIEVKVNVDTRRPARLAAAVLVTVERHGARTITVRNRSAVSTRLMWTSPGRAATGPDKPRAWLPGRKNLTLTWTRPEGAASPGGSKQQRNPADVSPTAPRSRRR